MEKLKEVFKLFFHLGLVAFGGPAAHMAMIHREVVQKREWMTDQHFLDLVGATSLIPGPNSTEMVIHCGFQRAGVKGLLTAGLAFIIPACLLTTLLAHLYTLAYEIPDFEAYMIGIRSVVIVLILQALQKLGKKAIKNYELLLVSILSFILALAGSTEVTALFLAGLVGFAILKWRESSSLKSVSLLSLFWVFTKVGSILFGSGYVLIAYLQSELVDTRAWLTSAQLADAVAIGQLTPGPVLSTSAFVGYLLQGGWGAFLASLGIFLPSFFFVFLLNPIIPKMRSSKHFSYFLDSINAAALGLMAYALYPLGKVSLTSLSGLSIFLIILLLTWKFPKLSSPKLVALGFILGTLSVVLQRQLG